MNKLIFLFVLGPWLWAQEPVTINGFVFDQGRPVEGVAVKIKDLAQGTLTDADGRYRIATKRGNVLQYSMLGYETVFRTVDGQTTNININLTEKRVALEDVTVSAKERIRTPKYKDILTEYHKNPDMIISSFGVKDKKTSGHALYVLDESELNTNALDFAGAIAGRFPIRNFRDSFYSDGSDPNPGPKILYDVDGMILSQPPNIPASFIKRVAFIPGLAGTSIYGSEGSSGVFIINTKNGFYEKPSSEAVNNKLKTSDLFYQGDAQPLVATQAFLPTALKPLIDSEKPEDVLPFFLQGNFKALTPIQKLQALQLIMESYGTTPTTQSIIDRFYRSGDFDLNHKRVLALIFSAYHLNNEALELYQEQFKRYPNRQRSYVDLYLTYEALGDTMRAKNFLFRYFHLIAEGFFPEPDNSVHGLMVKNLTRYQSKMGTLENGRFVYAEWEGHPADIELQFVGPDNRYFVWEPQSTAPGFLSDSGDGFYIEDAGQSWIMNGRKTKAEAFPVFLKISVFDFKGKRMQRKQLRCYVLYGSSINFKLLDF
ncbi:carboxypeptidase-like regulatory domain-containing protein [Sediminicola luteus]|uniref:TonB-dependent receptor plug domain-containing protein n=1 Tax=Sediminicola luteus TaxID=319238 RepID=A0A2A4G4H0_9FLAO|nr:carboxypeptidase-like regulatory domain-containing protein [Sediminicola luteus]PCE62876.1 hypothetical protein B7P33_16495 [Sediminicola luteus]